MVGEVSAGGPRVGTRSWSLVDRHPYVTTAVLWFAWLTAGLGVVVGGVRSGAIADPLGRWPHFGGSLWPLFSWDFGWYRGIAMTGYPHGHGGPEYAFFPLWPWILRASGSVPDWIAALAVVIAASAFAFAGVAAASPSGRGWRSALVLACWPGSLMLLLTYPDVIALAAAAWAAALALRGRPWLAGVLGAVAAVARPTGFLIAIALALATRGSRAGRLFAIAAPVAAAAAVHLFFWIRSGDPRAFTHAQALPIWERNGPGRLSKWPGHLAHAFEVHAALIAAGAIVAIILVVFIAGRFGRVYAAGAGYVFVVAGLLLGAQTSQSRIGSAIAAIVVPLLLVLWQLGPRYRPWALFATAVFAVSFFSATVTSLGRQALFAFPLYWAVADGPKPFRHPFVAAAAVAANVAILLTIGKYAP